MTTPRLLPIGHPVRIDDCTGRVVEHQLTTDRRATIVTYEVPGLGFNSYVVEHGPAADQNGEPK